MVATFSPAKCLTARRALLDDENDDRAYRADDADADPGRERHAESPRELELPATAAFIVVGFARVQEHEGAWKVGGDVR